MAMQGLSTMAYMKGWVVSGSQTSSLQHCLQALPLAWPHWPCSPISKPTTLSTLDENSHWQGFQ